MRKLIYILTFFVSFVGNAQFLEFIEASRQQQENSGSVVTTPPVVSSEGTISDNGNSTILTVNYPTTVNENNYLFLMCTASAGQSGGAGNSTWSTPTGWTELHQSATLDNSDQSAAIFYKIATSSEPSTVDVSRTSGGNVAIGSMIAVSGVTTDATWYDELVTVNSAGRVTGTGTDIPALSSTGENRTAILFFLIGDDVTLTGPSNYTTQEHNVSSTTGADAEIFVFSEELPTATTIAADNIDLSVDNKPTAAIALTLIPDGSAGAVAGNPPSTVTLSEDAHSDTTVDLSWTTATDDYGVTGYRVYVDGSLDQTLGTVTSTTVTGLTAETEYDFTVRAYDGFQEGSDSNTVTVTTDATPTSNDLYTWGDAADPVNETNTASSNWDIASDGGSFTLVTETTGDSDYSLQYTTQNNVNGANMLNLFTTTNGTNYNFQATVKTDDSGNFYAWLYGGSQGGESPSVGSDDTYLVIDQDFVGNGNDFSVQFGSWASGVTIWIAKISVTEQ